MNPPGVHEADFSEDLPILCHPEVWAWLSYGEYGHTIKVKYEVRRPKVTVDGYTAPETAERFCLGSQPNVSRTEKSMEIRNRIQSGIIFELNKLDVYLTNTNASRCSIFVQSKLCNFESRPRDLLYIDEVLPGKTIKVFNNVQFTSLLGDKVYSGIRTTQDLGEFCKVHISFSEPWNRNEGLRSSACWLEVNFTSPNKWLGQVCEQMKPPTPCGSGSPASPVPMDVE